ncbi:MAG: GNAT family N-acetyltransferase [Pseudomonadota bacterium]
MIVAFSEVAGSDKALAKIDEIFFESSSVQSFESDDAREAFRWLWMGRYLVEEPEHAFVALVDGDPDQLCGYLVGSLADPAPRKEFQSLSYFESFAHITPQFPAHLHINVARDFRSLGVGEQLIRAFLCHARASGCPGVHVVTGAGMRNVGFYERLHFTERARVAKGGGAAVLLGHQLD